MRLICPNCGAQYEIPDDVIPDSGRDVQCSNCSHTWLETPGASERRESEVEEAPEDIVSDAPYEFQEPAEVEEEPVASDSTAQESADVRYENQDDYEYEDELESDEQSPRIRRRSLDPSIAEILQEEAAREKAQRDAENSPLESQPDLGLRVQAAFVPPAAPPSPEEQRGEEARRRMARLRGEAVPPPSAPHSHRSELLPDIEEINSTLRSTAERTNTGSYEEETPRARKGGFGTGFILVILLGAIAAGLYVFHAEVSEYIPALTEHLTRYVEFVDGLRIWLDTQVQSLVAGN